jgi:hypothetical protein
MKTSEIIGCFLCSSFGLWWVVAPQSVIRFYLWFHRNKIIPMPTPMVIRILGFLWVVPVVGVTLTRAPR